MSIIINFLEELTVEHSYNNQIELSIDDNCNNKDFFLSSNKEVIFISKGFDCYYFMLSRMPSYTTNLCREIVIVDEKQHDFKIKKTETELFAYLENKINRQVIRKVLEKDDQELINLFEDKLKGYKKLTSIFLNYKLVESLESKKSHKKSKI